MTRIVILLIRAYQVSLGRLFPRVCRFEPTCSNYAIQAINEHGVLKGGLMGIWRIIRCNPFLEGGWDPVPAVKYQNNTECSTDKVNRKENIG